MAFLYLLEIANFIVLYLLCFEHIIGNVPILWELVKIYAEPRFYLHPYVKRRLRQSELVAGILHNIV